MTQAQCSPPKLPNHTLMNPSRLLASSLLCTGLLLCAATSHASDALVDFGALPAPASGECVEVNLPPALLAIASSATEKSDHETADLIRHLRLVHINVVKLDDSNRTQAIDHIRRFRESLKNWKQVVSVREPNGDDVDIRMKCRDDNTIEGFVITVLESKGDAVFVNIVGDLKPDQLGALAARLPIPGMPTLGLPAPAHT